MTPGIDDNQELAVGGHGETALVSQAVSTARAAGRKRVHERERAVGGAIEHQYFVACGTVGRRIDRADGVRHPRLECCRRDDRDHTRNAILTTLDFMTAPCSRSCEGDYGGTRRVGYSGDRGRRGA